VLQQRERQDAATVAFLHCRSVRSVPAPALDILTCVLGGDKFSVTVLQ
jgi:hypothetical protein